MKTHMTHPRREGYTWCGKPAYGLSTLLMPRFWLVANALRCQKCRRKGPLPRPQPAAERRGV